MKLLTQSLAIGFAGFFGAVARFLIQRFCYTIFPSRFPIGTLLINLSGSLFLGYFLARAAHRYTLSETTRLAIAVGFVGAYTTFSTFAYESNTLLEQGASLYATANLLGSLLLGLLAVRLGIALATP
jgi:CrcB protein